MNIGKKVTISQVASAAGVSKTTVSRYLNGRGDLMSEKTRERIKSVIELTNYQPSHIARSLKSQKTYQIGVIISDISSPFSSALILGIGEYLEDRGYTPIFVNCNDSREKEQKFVISLLAKGVDGLLVNTTCSENNFLINFASQGVPIVLCDRYINNYKFDIVTGEYDKAMYQAVSHLKEQGYTRPALFTQKWEYNSPRYIRRQGYLAAMKEIYGYDSEKDVYLISTHKEESTSSALKSFLKSLNPGETPAIIGINSVTTMHVLSKIKELKLLMPQQIGICGPEDWDWTPSMNWPNLVEPSVTTLVVHTKEIGAKAAQALLNRIDNSNLPPQEIILPTELIIRGSTLLNP